MFCFKNKLERAQKEKVRLEEKARMDKEKRPFEWENHPVHNVVKSFFQMPMYPDLKIQASRQLHFLLEEGKRVFDQLDTLHLFVQYFWPGDMDIPKPARFLSHLEGIASIATNTNSNSS